MPCSTGLVEAADRTGALTDDGIVANAILMMFAGHETTMNLLANGMVAVSRYTDQWARRVPTRHSRCRRGDAAVNG
ncbi:MAG TPA: hypothetical protein VGG05_10585 [Pseudonocardiaceae bacterium]|jgi:cytochrome P450